MNYESVFDVSVDPMDLAIRSGIVPHYGLDGMGDAQSDSIDAIAAVDPEPISRAALTLVSTIQKFFGGGAHLVANQITPIQLRIQNDILAPVSTAVDGPGASSLSQKQLQQISDALSRTKNNWLQMLHTAPLAGQKASTQAESTLAPYFSHFEQRIATLMQTAPSGILETIFGVPQTPGLVDPGIPGGTPVQSSYSGTGPVTQAGMGTIAMVVLGGIALTMLLGSRQRGGA